METHMTRIEKRAFLIAALKEKIKWPRCYLVITDNHKFFKKNTEYNYLIKKHKLNINKKKTYILRTSSIRLLQGNKPLNQRHGSLYEHYQSPTLLT